MKTNSTVSITCTLNADDMLQLAQEGELKQDGIVIGTTGPELDRFKELLKSVDEP